MYSRVFPEVLEYEEHRLLLVDLHPELGVVDMKG